MIGSRQSHYHTVFLLLLFSLKFLCSSPIFTSSILVIVFHSSSFPSPHHYPSSSFPYSFLPFFYSYSLPFLCFLPFITSSILSSSFSLCLFLSSSFISLSFAPFLPYTLPSLPSLPPSFLPSVLSSLPYFHTFFNLIFSLFVAFLSY